MSTLKNEVIPADRVLALKQLWQKVVSLQDTMDAVQADILRFNQVIRPSTTVKPAVNLKPSTATGVTYTATPPLYIDPANNISLDEAALPFAETSMPQRYALMMG
jgi:hypothetical protein